MEKKKHKKSGDLNKENLIKQMIRVNHAGEYGAKRIYQGQLSILKDHVEIKHMAEQENEHLEFFEKEIKKRKVRPSLFFPLWHAAGYAIGAVCALMGEKAAMACTEAVEEVINEHYLEQINQLNDEEDSYLKDNIEKFRQEELEHHNIAVNSGSEDAPIYEVLKAAVKFGSKVSIWLAKKF